MTEDIAVYTKTMARIYADQGHLEKAVRIYRHMIREAPDRRDLIDELAWVEEKLARESTRHNAALVRLFGAWFDAMQTAGAIQKLRWMQRWLAGSGLRKRSDFPEGTSE